MQMSDNRYSVDQIGPDAQSYMLGHKSHFYTWRTSRAQLQPSATPQSAFYLISTDSRANPNY